MAKVVDCDDRSISSLITVPISNGPHMHKVTPRSKEQCPMGRMRRTLACRPTAKQAPSLQQAHHAEVAFDPPRVIAGEGSEVASGLSPEDEPLDPDIAKVLADEVADAVKAAKRRARIKQRKRNLKEHEEEKQPKKRHKKDDDDDDDDNGPLDGKPCSPGGCCKIAAVQSRCHKQRRRKNINLFCGETKQLQCHQLSVQFEPIVKLDRAMVGDLKNKNN